MVAPLSSSEVRDFKKEMKSLLSDPVGLSQQFDQFLGPNIFTWPEMQSILQSLFSLEEQRLIRTTGIKIWERENNDNQGPPGESKMPIENPYWDPNAEEDKRSMEDHRKLIVKGIREAVPRTNNIKKAFGTVQEKNESPMEWLARLRNNIQLYTQMDLDSESGATMLKVHFVLYSWPDIRKTLEKMDKWPEKDLKDLLEEAQKVYLRRDEENWKVKAKIMRAGEAEPKMPEKNPEVTPQVSMQTTNDRRQHFCTYCSKQGHGTWYCFRKRRDEEARQVENQVLSD